MSNCTSTALPRRQIDILCRVIDNYGDAGVVLRLARDLRRVCLARGQASPVLRLFVDRPDILDRLAPGIVPDPAHGPATPGLSWLPDCSVVTMGPAQESGSLAAAWDGIPAPLVIQAFDAALFAPYRQALESRAATAQAAGLPVPRHLLLNLEYLSAEDWTAEYHRLPSLSGLAGVDKFFFLPGFIPGTGGLLWGDQPPAPTTPAGVTRLRQAFLAQAGLAACQVPADADRRWWLSLFSYEHDYTPLVQTLAGWQQSTPEFQPLVLVAAGRGAAGFLDPWEQAGRPFPVLRLPFLAQDSYDRLVPACDLNIVRGEESLARAVLAGVPFLWHAYLQDEAWQLVKVQALLDRLSPWLPTPHVRTISQTFQDFNQRLVDQAAGHALETWDQFLQACRTPEVRQGYAALARTVAGLGDLAANLLDFAGTKGF